MFLYRAVSSAEYDDILAKGQFDVIALSMESKWFAEMEEHAQEWGRVFYPGQPFFIVRVDVADEVAHRLFCAENLDGIGSARCAELQDLIGATIELVREVTL